MPDVIEADGKQLMDVLVVECVEHVAPLAAVAHEPTGAQQAQVVRARGLREAGRRGEFADAQLPGLQQDRDQAHAPGIGEHAKRLGQRLEDPFPGQPLDGLVDPGCVAMVVVATIDGDDGRGRSDTHGGQSTRDLIPSHLCRRC